MHRLAQLDHRYVWHPFTQMQDWLKQKPIVITRGQGAVLQDVHGREYLDANSSIWTNLHGHNHPKINTAIQRQLKKISHSSALGFANKPASLLAEKLVKAANPEIYDLRWTIDEKEHQKPRKSKIENRKLQKVFFSDDGSTAMEVALKLAYEFARRSGFSEKPRFLTLDRAYHGDTVGAVSLGHIDLFHRRYRDLLFKSDQVMSPYCYRCPFNRARPERADAREYRQCHWECVDMVEKKFHAQKKRGNPYAALVVEPLIQGAAGMIPQPVGWLRRVADIARGHGALLIADEVMTGFGRTGVSGSEFRVSSLKQASQNPELGTRNPELLFACHHEGVQPDFLALAKGMTGGYLPMAATLTTQAVFDAFLGDYAEFKTFFHGHSFTANQLGAAAALASLELLHSEQSIRARQKLEQTLRAELQTLWALRNVGDIRQVGLIVGVELIKDWRTRKPFDLRERAGIRVCEAMARRGVLTRPVGNAVVLMPPYCTTAGQAQQMVNALFQAIQSELGAKARARS
ncbi:MAG TPA: aminotransferase class III-fold pyridoxal phosphate-dependent enzyme [Candidatus Eisenbacteria bacterium]|nr:aminotransferase class III-fold pyridoxal phosphate-dependent enzyme [Candidatus Eisenbacteria bacterium]